MTWQMNALGLGKTVDENRGGGDGVMTDSGSMFSVLLLLRTI